MRDTPIQQYHHHCTLQVHIRRISLEDIRIILESVRRTITITIIREGSHAREELRITLESVRRTIIIVIREECHAREDLRSHEEAHIHTREDFRHEQELKGTILRGNSILEKDSRSKRY